jgi:hypothetical protein
MSEDTDKRYYGKYRGTVILNLDPLFKGRIRALVPSVTEFNPTTWVEPCSPFAGPASGFFFVPPISSTVWIEFVEGNPRFPIYSGGLWNETDLALIPPQSKPFVVPNETMIRTMSGATITFTMTPPGITIQTIDMKKISINPTGIEISLGAPTTGIVIDAAGNVRITSPTSISINAPKVSINSP